MIQWLSLCDTDMNSPNNDIAPPQCSDSTVASPAAPVRRRRRSDLASSSECDTPSSGRPIFSPLCLSGRAAAGSSDDSSDEWSDASSVTFLPSSSVDSADDFILFVNDETQCCPQAPASSEARLGACADQSDPGLSVETNQSDSDSSEDECDSCLNAPTGTCATHQRILQANKHLRHWCGTPPPRPRTSRVRFLSGDRLATIQAAPDYDRSIASDLLDQQRQRDRVRRWRQEVDCTVAPVLSAVLTPQHRQKVLRERLRQSS